MTFFDIWCIFNHFFIEILCLGLHFSIQVCLQFNWCVTAGKIENIHLPMQVPFCKIKKTIQGPGELNAKIDNLHWQCKSPLGTRIVPMLFWNVGSNGFHQIWTSKQIYFVNFYSIEDWNVCTIFTKLECDFIRYLRSLWPCS